MFHAPEEALRAHWLYRPPAIPVPEAAEEPARVVPVTVCVAEFFCVVPALRVARAESVCWRAVSVMSVLYLRASYQLSYAPEAGEFVPLTVPLCVVETFE